MKESLIKKTTVQWRVTRLLELGIIQRIARGRYSIGEQTVFRPYLTPQINKIYNHLVTEFSNNKYCIWSTEWLKTYLPRMKVQITFVEGIRTHPSSFFFHLWEKRDGTVWYGLPKKVSKTFGKKQTIVRKMISGSPLMESDEIFYAHLEKIIVDLYCDWNSIYPYENQLLNNYLKSCAKTFQSMKVNSCVMQIDEKRRNSLLII